MKKFIYLTLSSLLLAACSAAPKTTQTETPTTQDNSPASPTTETAKTFSGTIKAALALGVPLKCTSTVDGNSVTGYIKAGQYYSEYSIAGNPGFMLIKDSCSYIWQDGQTTGIKFCVSPTPGSTGNEAIIDNPKTKAPTGDVNCLPTSVDDSKFVLPTDITFSEMPDFSKGIPNLKNIPGMKDIPIPTGE